MAKAVPVRVRPSAPSSGARPAALSAVADAPVPAPRSEVVAASAGTGKTWQLTTRILRLLLGGAEPPAILAITFTRKAAAEIRARVLEFLTGWLRLDDAALARALRDIGLEIDPERPSPELLAAARGLYERLQFAEQDLRITTFDAFFQDLLQRFPLEAGIPVGYRILSEDRADRMQRTAVDRLLEEAARRPDGELGRAMRFLERCAPSLMQLRDYFDRFLTRALEWRVFEDGREPEALRRELDAAFFGPDGPPDPLEDPALGLAFEEEQLDRLADLLRKSGASERSHQARAAAKLRRALAQPEAATLERLQRIHEALFNDDGEPRGSLYSLSKTARERLGTNAGEYEELLHRYRALVPEALDWHLRQRNCELNRHWYRLGARLVEHYQRLKRQAGQMDFDDQRLAARRLMHDGVEWVQYKLGQQFHHILVDEFQDTDDLSWQILLPFLEALREAADGDGRRGRSAFIVGDVKQSIYQWRRANPELQDEAGRYLTGNLDARARPLDASRRSAAAVIRLVNACFGEGGCYAGALPGFQPHQTHRTELWGRVELMPVPERAEAPAAPPAGDGLRDPLTEPRPERGGDEIAEQAARLAARIQDLLGSGVAVEDPETREPRRLRHRDILILVRARTHLPQIERELARRRIPFARQSRQTLLNHLEVLDLLALLKVLTYPVDDLSLAQVLRSPLYGAGDRDLAALAAAGDGPWYERLQRAAGTDAAHPLRRAASDLERWRRLVGRIPTHDLLDRVYFEADALRRYRAALPDETGAQAASNLTRFLELALELDSGRYPSTPAFVQYLEDMRAGRIPASDAPDLIPAGARDDRVRILTVHAAKGLESPVVFYAVLKKTRRMEKSGDVLIDWPAGEPRPRSFLCQPGKREMDSLSRRCLEAARCRREAEIHNQDYVAFTRARQLLVLCAHEEMHEELATAFAPEDDGAEPPSAAALAFETGERAAAPEPAPPPEPAADPAGLDQPIAPAPAGPPGDDEEYGSGEAAARARARGTLIHALLELLDGGAPDTAALERIARGQNLEAEDGLFQDCLREARAVLEDPALAAVFRPDAAVRVYREAPIGGWAAGDGADGPDFGIVDRLHIGERDIWVIDFKSHATEDPGELKKIAQSEIYAEQMGRYARILAAAYPERPVRCSLLFTRSRQLKDIAIGQEK